jgi:cold shock CspA family protein
MLTNMQASAPSRTEAQAAHPCPALGLDRANEVGQNKFGAREKRTPDDEARPPRQSTSRPYRVIMLSRVVCMLAVVAQSVSALTIGATPAVFRHAAAASARSPCVVAAANGELKKGVCKWFDTTKGYGFIAIDGEDVDIFVHQTDIYAEGFRSLAEGESVEFIVNTDPKTKKLKATEVTGPEGAYVQGAAREDPMGY